MRLADLEIPSRPEFVSVARLVIGSIADRYDISSDQLDYLKLAVSEACVLAMEHPLPESDGAVHITCEGALDRLEISIDAPAQENLNLEASFEAIHIEPDRLNVEKTLGMPLIEGLVDDVAIERSGNSAVLKMTLNCELAEAL